jgi:hypothetical protein
MAIIKGKTVLKDQPLFGAVDQVINTLELEIRFVKDEIMSARKTILRKEEEIAELDGRLKNLVDSMATVRKDRPKKKA